MWKPRLTENTLVTQADLMAEIEHVCKQGYAINNEENELDGHCTGAPVHGPDGRVLGAAGISGPLFRMDMNHTRSLAPELKPVCVQIAAAMRLG